MKILYVGRRSGTSFHRANALVRLGHDVEIVDPWSHPTVRRMSGAWLYKAGGPTLDSIVRCVLKGMIGPARWDIALVDSGDVVGRRSVSFLRSKANKVINYNPDNPYVSRDGLRWRIFRSCLADYDLIVVPRRSSYEAAIACGARDALQVTFAADELVHQPRALTKEEKETFTSDVAFVGTWMPGRGMFVEKLLDEGLNVRVYGPRWQKSSRYKFISHVVYNASLNDAQYTAAILGSKIALGLLSEQNLDLHTTRSLEITSLGVVFCGQRTADHASMYIEGEEAIFFDNAEECASICRQLLKQPARLQQIADRGRIKFKTLAARNEVVMDRMIRAALDSD